MACCVIYYCIVASATACSALYHYRDSQPRRQCGEEQRHPQFDHRCPPLEKAGQLLRAGAVIDQDENHHQRQDEEQIVEYEEEKCAQSSE
jgi:hypothetical protein